MNGRPHTTIGRRGLLVGGATAGALAVVGRGARSAQAALQPPSVTVVDVRTQGAVGDGLADDTAAFERAFALVGRSGGGIVFVPSGNYRVDGLRPPACCTLRGESAAAVLQAPPLSTRPAVIEIGASRVTVENLTVDGNRPQQQGPPNCVNVTGATDTALRDLHIRGATGHGVALTAGAKRTRVEGCHIDANGRNGVTVAGADDVAIVGNVFTDNGRSAIHLAAATTTATGLLVLGNVVHGAGSLVPGASAIRVDDGCRDVVVSANAVSATAPGSSGIVVASSSGRAVGCATVSGNIVAGVGGDAVVAAGQGVSVTGNSLRGAAGAGVAANGDDVAIISNTVTGCGRAGIRVVGAARSFIAGNVLHDNLDGPGATSQDAALSLIGSPPGARGLLVANASTSANGAPALRVSAARARTVGAGSSTGATIGPVAESGTGRYVAPTNRLGLVTVGSAPQAVPHGRPSAPTNVVITMRSGGAVWLSGPPDATNVVLCADGPGRTCEVRVG